MKPRKHVGLIPGGFKPFHKGHFSLVEAAAKENDVVYLIVGTADRKRKGEFPIKFSEYKQVWDNYISKILPTNVELVFSSSPVREVYETLTEASEDTEDNNTYTLYGDPDTLKGNFPKDRLQKYAERLDDNNQIMIRSFDRSLTGGISGTRMREYLQAGDLEQFADSLPEPLRKDAVEIMRILKP